MSYRSGGTYRHSGWGAGRGGGSYRSNYNRTQTVARQPQQFGQRPTVYISERRLQDWANRRHDPSELLMFMVSNAPELTQFLNSSYIPVDSLKSLVLSLQAVLSVKVHESNVSKLLDVLATTQFYTTHMLGFLRQNCTAMNKNISDAILELIYETAVQIPQSVNRCRNILVFLLDNKQALSCDRNLLQKTINAFNGSAKAEARKDKYRLQRWKQSDEPPDDIRDLKIFPTRQDLDTDIKPFLRSNNVKGAYKDKGHYFDVQFRLMREDFIQPLREGIAKFTDGGSFRNDSSMLFYTGVRIVGLSIFSGIEHLLRLDMQKFGNVRWDAERRLIHGSLVCLSHDNFKTIIYATVTQIERDELKNNGLLRVRFQNCLEDIYSFSSEQTFVMTENPSFFEAYRHVLEAMREMLDTDLPMERYLVQCERDVTRPVYVTYGTTYDLSCLRNSHTQPLGFSNNLVLRPDTWPDISRLCLNEHQFEAVSTALTKELALLQGPPGTGKTYVGLKIMEILLKNLFPQQTYSYQTVSTSPILVVCYTNHALDQFLEGILPICKDGIVRVGGRSQSADLQRFNLKTLRMGTKDSMSSRNCIKDCHREMDQLARKIEQLSYDMQLVQLSVQSHELLESHMEGRHYRSLMRKGRSMKQWLHSSYEDFDFFLRSAVEAHLISLIVKGRKSSEDTSLDFSRRIPPVQKLLAYRGWLKQLRQKQLCVPDNDILPDENLLAAISPMVYIRIKRQNRSVKEWLLGQTVEDMLAAIENIQQESLDVKKVFDNTDEYRRIYEQRMFDDEGDSDDEMGGGARSRRRPQTTLNTSVFARAKRLGVDLMREDKVDSSNDATSSSSFIPLRKVIQLLKTLTPLTSDEERHVTDVWQLPLRERYQLYKLWLNRYLASLNLKMRELVDGYEKILQRKLEVRHMQSVSVLKKAKVIGMTTTGAAKHRKLLQAVGPRIVVVEEAAEVLESHIITALSTRCQHLILIGDHQQLRPKTEVHQLAKDFGLDVSLFERLINNGFKHVQLTEQHRMRPHISMYMKHIYPNLRNSASVRGRENIRGMAHNVYFITHDRSEQAVAHTKSKSNEYEAQYLLKLCNYLLFQGYSSSEITILATYGGQVNLIKELITNSGKSNLQNVRVSTVDNFQGEQNKIILLSLVRSNSEEKVGFLSTDNRVCVALSRAQYGMYVIGDIELLSRHSQLWENIRSTAQAQQRIGETLKVRCRQHKIISTIQNISDFDKLRTGGCGQNCGGILPCGHECPYLCHAVEHSRIECEKPCPKKCIAGHRCPKTCSEPCPPCEKKTLVKVSWSCGHIGNIRCNKKPSSMCDTCSMTKGLRGLSLR